jgi:hypothetical protein
LLSTCNSYFLGRDILNTVNNYGNMKWGVASRNWYSGSFINYGNVEFVLGTQSVSGGGNFYNYGSITVNLPISTQT